jgi:hypothetical protein
MIKFTGPLYNLLQYFTNHYLRLDTLDLWPHNTNLFLQLNCQSESYVTTDGQSASLSWNKAPIWGLRPDFHCCPKLNCQLLLPSLYIASGRTTQKTHPLPSNECPLLLRIHCRGMYLVSRCLAMGLCFTIFRMKKWRRLNWAGHVPRIEHMYIYSSGRKTSRKEITRKNMGRLRSKCMDWIHLAQNTGSCEYCTEPLDSIKRSEFLGRWATISFWRIQFHGGVEKLVLRNGEYIEKCKIWGFHGGDYDDHLLGNITVWLL